MYDIDINLPKGYKMSQHFLLSSKARSLNIINIVKMSDMEAFEMFKAIRFNITNVSQFVLVVLVLKNHTF